MIRPARSAMRLLRPFERHLWLWAIVALHACVAAAVGVALGRPYEPGMATAMINMFQLLVPIFVFALLLWRLGQMAVVLRPARPLPWLIADLRRVLLDGDRLLGGMIGLAAVALLLSSFSFIKPLIPQIAPFSWDPAFAALDRALHGGVDPYRLLMPVFGHPYALKALNIAYHAWFFLFYFFVFVACFSKGSARGVFLVAFALTWILGGNGLAILLSSGGPVYYAPLGYGPDFEPLMAHLRSANEIASLPALGVQASLWDSYVGAAPPRGISAMPSMHVAVSVLMALGAFRHARWAGWLMTLFAVIIMIGSVMLAWHYAVDGYLGAAVALLCWGVARRLVEGRAAAVAPAPALVRRPA